MPSVLEPPPAETELESVQAPLDEETQGTGGYPVKFARRRKAAGAASRSAPKLSRREAEASRQRSRLIALALKLLVPGLLLVGVIGLFGLGAGDERVPLPKAFEPASFAGLLEFSSTERVGTLFHGTLRDAPDPASDADFRSRVETVAGSLASAGYQSLLILAPDGTTLASGTVQEIKFAEPGAKGT